MRGWNEEDGSKNQKKNQDEIAIVFFSNLCRYLLMLAELMVVRHLYRVVSSMNWILLIIRICLELRHFFCYVSHQFYLDRPFYFIFLLCLSSFLPWLSFLFYFFVMYFKAQAEVDLEVDQRSTFSEFLIEKINVIGSFQNTPLNRWL